MKLALINLGRRGGGVQLTSRLFDAARTMNGIDPHVIVSSDNESAEFFRAAAPKSLLVDTFSAFGSAGLLTNYWRSRAAILHYLQENRVDAVFNVMPHVWTPLLMRDIRRRGIRYGTLIHDVEMHPGDPTALATRWLLSEAKAADLVVTMSKAVTERLAPRRVGKVMITAFHPDYVTGSVLQARTRDASRPLRLLFFGRIFAYKGLPMLVEAIGQISVKGIAIELCVAGAGDLGAMRARLEAMGADIRNHWHDEAEIDALFARADIAVLSHVEASQSGIPALAYAHAMPVIATPVGGLTEQINHRRTGLLSEDISAAGLASAIETLARDPDLYDRMSENIVAEADARSPTSFLRLVVEKLSVLNA